MLTRRDGSLALCNSIYVHHAFFSLLYYVFDPVQKGIGIFKTIAVTEYSRSLEIARELMQGSVDKMTQLPTLAMTCKGSPVH
jgi:hypothetical protein